MGERTIPFFSTETGDELGRVSAEELTFLKEKLEEEELEDVDYWFDEDCVDFLEEEEGSPADLVKLLRDLIAGKEGVELRFGSKP